MMEKRSKIIIIVCTIATTILFGISQYLSATHLSTSILESKIIQRNIDNSLYNMTLQFKNPSLLPLNIGKTDFTVTINDENLGSGMLQPFIIPPMGMTISQTSFLADNTILHKYDNSDNIPNVQLIGISRYEILIITVNAPFTYYPTPQEARDFIHGTGSKSN